MTAPTSRAALLLAALAACTPARGPDAPAAPSVPAAPVAPTASSAPGARLALGQVKVACRPQAGAAGARCDLSAELDAGGADRALAVLTVREGDRLVRQVVVPVEGGRGALRLEGVEAEAAAPTLAVTLLGEVTRPAGVTLRLTGLVSECAAPGEPGGCTTRGRVESSDRAGRLVVVEVRPPGQSPHHAFVRLHEGAGALLSEWSGAAPGTAAPAVTVEVLGLVAARPAP